MAANRSRGARWRLEFSLSRQDGFTVRCRVTDALSLKRRLEASTRRVRALTPYLTSCCAIEPGLRRTESPCDRSTLNTGCPCMDTAERIGDELADRGSRSPNLAARRLSPGTAGVPATRSKSEAITEPSVPRTPTRTPTALSPHTLQQHTESSSTVRRIHDGPRWYAKALGPGSQKPPRATS
jgi:hypothetical protein